jgi:hypothetical protein
VLDRDAGKDAHHRSAIQVRTGNRRTICCSTAPVGTPPARPEKP